jgi:N-acetylneuraminic acid mutarotase
MVLLDSTVYSSAEVKTVQGDPTLGTWRQAASALIERTEVTATALDGKIYVIGGLVPQRLAEMFTLPPAVTDVVEEYDTATDRWTTKSPLPRGLHHTAAVAVGGRVYVLGGYTHSLLSTWEPVASLFVFDPSTDRWTEGPPMPTARGALAAAELNGKIVAIGGYDRRMNVAAVEAFDPSTGRWTSLPPLPTPRDHLAVVSAEGRLYALGGRVNGDYGRNLSVVEVYDSGSNRWDRIEDLPLARSGITAGVISRVIHVLGGEGPGGTFRENHAYSLETKRWTENAPMPTPRHGLGSAVVQGHLYTVSGGPKPGGSYSNVVEVFTPPLAKPAGYVPASGASKREVGAAMAVLATLEDAGVLPPEGTPQANRIVKAVIQFQSLFMKSHNPAVDQFLRQAVEAKVGPTGAAAITEFRERGWTSYVLEAVLDWDKRGQVEDQQGLEAAFREFNVQRSDLNLLAQLYDSARQRFSAQGKSIHQVFAGRRRAMPGASSELERERSPTPPQKGA